MNPKTRFFKSSKDIKQLTNDVIKIIIQNRFSFISLFNSLVVIILRMRVRIAVAKLKTNDSSNDCNGNMYIPFKI